MQKAGVGGIQGGQQKQHADLKSEQKWAILCWSMPHYDAVRGEFRAGAKRIIANRFGISERGVARLMKDYQDKIAIPGTIYPDLAPLKEGHCGAPSQRTDLISEQITDLHYMTLGELDIEMFCEQYEIEFGQHISRHTMETYLIDIGCYSIRTYVKPYLTIEQRIARLEFVLERIESNGHGKFFFRQVFTIYLDEKWFYSVEKSQRKRKFAEEVGTKSTPVQHKGHIPKTMFLSAISSPKRIADERGGISWFNGKLNIFPFVHEGVAVRDSKNRLAGAPVLEDVSVTAEVFFDTMKDEVLPAIKEALPQLQHEKIVLRLDNAKAHTGEYNPELLGVLMVDGGWDMELEFQPAKSPDLNLNDLCFFNALKHQTNKIKARSANKEEMIAAVKKAYDDYDVATLARMEGLMYEIYRKILENDGGNQFAMPHSGIRQRQNMGEEVCDLEVPPDLHNSAKKSLATLKASLLGI
jgi:hypothetical protein